MTIGLFFFVLICALFLALLEIQIEGGHGWAEKLPTWQIKNPFSKIIGWTKIDGYHLYLWALFILLFHLPYFFGITINSIHEFVIIESLYLFMVCEDFLWFVFNPAWGIKNFFTKEIPWHPNKILYFPQNYWIAGLILVLLEAIKYLIFGQFLW